MNDKDSKPTSHTSRFASLLKNELLKAKESKLSSINTDSSSNNQVNLVENTIPKNVSNAPKENLTKISTRVTESFPVTEYLKSFKQQNPTPPKDPINENIKNIVTEEIAQQIQSITQKFPNYGSTGGGGGTNAVQYALGGTINGELNVTGKYLSGGVDLADIFLTSGTNSQTLLFDPSTSDLSISNGNTVSLASLAGGSLGGTIDSNVRALTSAWESAYTTVKSNSAAWGTDLDSQALSFNETTKDLTISNGNTISLSALVDVAGVDTSIRALTSVWQGTYTNFKAQSANNDSVYTTVNSNSATRWDKELSNTYTRNNFLPLSGGTITGNLSVLGNLTINGLTTSITATNLAIEDPLIFIAKGNTTNVRDIGIVGQYNNGLQQYSGLTRLASTNKWTLFSGVTSDPIAYSNIPISDPFFKIETLVANLEGNATTVTDGVYTTGSYSDPTWIISLSSGKIVGPERDEWDSTYTTVNSNSATWNSAGVDTSIRALTSVWQGTYTNFKSQSANNSTVYTTVNSNSATWGSVADSSKLLPLSGGTMIGRLNIKTTTETLVQPTINGTSGVCAIELSAGSVFTVDLTRSITSFDVLHPPAAPAAHAFVLQLKMGTTPYSVGWVFNGSTVKWENNIAPTVTTTSNKTDTFVFMSYDGGVTYYGFTSSLNA